MKTLADLFFCGLGIGDPGRALADPEGPPPLSPLRWISREDLEGRVARLAAGLRDLGLKAGDRVALMSENRTDWTAVDFAAQCLGIVIVPLYPTLSRESVRFIVEDCGARAAFASQDAYVELLCHVRAEAPALQKVIGFGSDAIGRGADLTLEHLEAAAAGDPEDLRGRAGRLDSEDLASIVYTSGTTGSPKGVMLSHGNIVSNVRSATRVLPLLDTDVALSFLPLSHIFERTVDYCLWQAGASLVYCPRIEWVAGMLQQVKPTFFAGVPRLYEKVFQRIGEEAEGAGIFQRLFFRWARGHAQEIAGRRMGGDDRHTGPVDALADRAVGGPVRGAFGGNVRICLNGGAPLRPAVCRFFWGFGVPIYGGYGLTETAPILCTNYPGKVRCGSVGPALPRVELRIAEDGEVLAKGPNVMQGYWGNPRATLEAYDNGWLRTGDLGRIDDDGHLVLVGRKKELIVTSGGKNVAPIPIEEAIRECDLIEDVMLVGDGRRFLAVLVVPAQEALQRWAQERDIADREWETLLDHPDVRELFESEVRSATERLGSHEQPRKVGLLPRPFLFSEGELTATGKLRRGMVEESFSALIDELYE